LWFCFTDGAFSRSNDNTRPRAVTGFFSIGDGWVKVGVLDVVGETVVVAFITGLATGLLIT
jgi:hypothetical protein